MAPMVGAGGVCVWLSLESGGRFCVGAFSRNLVPSVTVKMFPRLIYFIKTFMNDEHSVRFAKTMLKICEKYNKNQKNICCIQRGSIP
jgi:hypothetical protein